MLRMRTTRRRISWPSALHSTRNQSHANTARMKNAPHFWEGLSHFNFPKRGVGGLVLWNAAEGMPRWWLSLQRHRGGPLPPQLSSL